MSSLNQVYRVYRQASWRKESLLWTLLFEETGIVIDLLQIKWMGLIYFCKPTNDYTYTLFKVAFSDFPKIKLSQEYFNYQWVSEKERLALPLMAGAEEAFRTYSKLLNRRFGIGS